MTLKMITQPPLKIYLGCGERRLYGFCHVDIREDVKPDVCTNALDLSAFQPNSVQEVYFCHGIEHIKETDVDHCLMEIHRILIPGTGIIRLALPDFRALATLYCARRARLSDIVYAMHGQQDYPENTHFFSWDLESLTARLSRNGFMDIQRYNPHVFLPAGYFDWSLHQIAGTPTSLNVTAIKFASSIVDENTGPKIVCF